VTRVATVSLMVSVLCLILFYESCENRYQTATAKKREKKECGGRNSDFWNEKERRVWYFKRMTVVRGRACENRMEKEKRVAEGGVEKGEKGMVSKLKGIRLQSLCTRPPYQSLFNTGHRLIVN
jgi:hypothetical protein